MQIPQCPRPHTACVVGIALGDEGKGRIIDNLIGVFLKKKSITGVTVVRFQGGSNSGHTVEVGNVKLALHQVPSGVMYKRTTCIMDRGMTIHPVDLIEEIRIVESIGGSIQGRLFLSSDAILNTDLDRAEERLNRIRQDKAAGGTGRGIGPSYAHHYDRLGFHISDFMSNDWIRLLGRQFDRYAKEFAVYGMKLSRVEVPDFAQTKKLGKECTQVVGTKPIFLNRLAQARRKLVRRRIVCNTFPMHEALYSDTRRAAVFEGAQAVGLHAWLGTFPDITASDTSVYGLHAGTAFWRKEDIETRIGVFKIPYTSSVGVRHMPTRAGDHWAARVREAAHEYGTTTGRPRDILYPDLALLSYNARMSGVSSLIGTHLDIAWEDMPIPVCTHYEDKHGRVISYQPGLQYLIDAIPHYVTLPGWDGEAVRTAKTYAQLPVNAKKFLAFIKKHLGLPILAVTTGPARENYVEIKQ